MSILLVCSGGLFDIEKIKQELGQLEEEIENDSLWDDPKKATILLKKQKSLANTLELYSHGVKEYAASKELYELALASQENSIMKDLEQTLDKLAKQIKSLELDSLFKGNADGNNAFIEIHAGAGGTESHDWASILLRMYLRFCEKHDLETQVVDILDGEEAGIKYATIKACGLNAYGMLKNESGVHRLVRISPFNAAGKRHTSFASVWVFPEVDNSINIDIKESDLRIDTFRSSGAGGQHVNTTDSAVRITHLPTKIVVQCQNDRSQHKNKDEAMSMLKARLYELELRKREEEANKENSQKTDNSWGNQIRSYVMQPYQMVKDHRTDYESSAIDDVLDGNLDDFIYAKLVSSKN